MSDSVPTTPAQTDIANIHLQLAGQERTVSVTFQTGQQSVRDLLPVARELSQHITGMAIESAEHQGRTISCRAGCAACCRQMVAISLADAQALAELVASLAPESQAVIRARFAQAILRLEQVGLLDPHETKGNRRLISADESDPQRAMWGVASRYFAQQIPCPFLENECCSIYDERPLICREYHVSSPPEHCARLYEIGVDPVEVPVRMGEVIIQVAHQIAGARKEAIPLVLALEWAEAHPRALAHKSDSLQMLRTLLTEIDQECAKAFSQRPAALQD